MGSVARWLFGVALLATSLVAAPAAARSMAIAGFDAHVQVAVDGAIDVTETISVDFEGAWQGLYRTIPVEYQTSQGLGYSLQLELRAVTDAAGNPLRYDQSREGRFRKLKVHLSGAQDTRKFVVITYRVPNALRFFADHDELYWNVTGDEWDVPVGAASARIELPAGTTGLHADAYTGPHGATAGTASVAIADATVNVRTGPPLGYREGLTVAVAWNKGVVREPPALTRVFWFARGNWPFGLPLAAGLLMTCLWLGHGRDPRRRPIGVRSEPPSGLTPAEVGALVEERCGTVQIVATIVDLASRGYLSITYDRSGSTDYLFRLEKEATRWSDLKAHERALLGHMFGGLATIRLSQLENVFYQHIPGIRAAVFDGLVARGYYRRSPERVRARYIGAAFVVLVGLCFVGLPAAASLGTAPLPVVLAAVLSALVVGLIGYQMPAVTETGGRALAEALGFREFLEAAVAARAQAARQPRLFETMLPYAIALFVDEGWGEAFAGLGASPPTWYVDPADDPYDSLRFTGRMRAMSTQMNTTLTSAPASNSDSSGSSGGGSSGGGFGGGGGGGF